MTKQGMLPHLARIKETIWETPHVKTFVLEAEIEAQPGQFLMVWLPGVDEKPFSLVEADPVTLTALKVGPFSERLHELKAGDRLGYRGPFGRGYSWAQEGPILLVGGGCGVAPLYFLAKEALRQKLEVWAAVGAKAASELAFEKRFEDLGCRVLLSTDDGSRGMKGLVTETILDVVGEVKAIYGCGPEPMLKVLTSLCSERGIPGQMSLERYMKCGFGICGQCALDDKLVCLDGPVFSVEELEGVRDFGRVRRNAAGSEVAI